MTYEEEFEKKREGLVIPSKEDFAKLSEEEREAYLDANLDRLYVGEATPLLDIAYGEFSYMYDPPLIAYRLPPEA